MTDAKPPNDSTDFSEIAAKSDVTHELPPQERIAQINALALAMGSTFTRYGAVPYRRRLLGDRFGKDATRKADPRKKRKRKQAQASKRKNRK